VDESFQGLTSPPRRAVGELLSDDPAWPLVRSWLGEATNDVVVLPGNRGRGEDALYRLQVTTRSPLGAVALETGGILVDHGWLRMLGCGGGAMRASLTTWNAVGGSPEIEPMQGALVVAYDAIGGFFALNGGAFAGEPGHVFYLPPDTLAWETLERGYSEFLQWVLHARLDDFYAGLRWAGWQDELAGASPDDGFSLYPPPFTKEGRPVAGSSRKLVPMPELWDFYREAARRLGPG
jgi:Protein of unknown function DUF2625